MEQGKLSRAELLRKIRSYHTEFEAAIQEFEKEDVAAASATALKIMDGVEDLVDHLSKDYRHALFQNRLTDFHKDQTQLKSTKAAEKGKSDARELMPVLIRLESHLTQVEAEIDRLYPRPPFLMPFLRRYKKPLIAAVAVFLVAVFAFTAHERAQAKRQGLVGRYYSDMEFGEFFKERLDSVVDFNWAMNAPLRKWKKDKFSIRWTGFVRVPVDGTYEFITYSDDGVRLFLGDDKVIEDWSTHGVRMDRAELELKAGYYPIKLEYYDSTRKSVIRLYWRPEGQTRAVPIPAENLVPASEYLKSKIPVITPAAGSLVK